MHSSGLVALAMLLVAASFSASLWYSHRLVQSIDDEAHTLVEDTIPSVEHLATVRMSLRDAAMYAIQCVVGGCDQALVHEYILIVRRSRDDALQSLTALPTASEEEEQAVRELKVRCQEIDAAVERTLAASEAGSPEEASATLRNVLQPGMLAAERSIDALQAWNARQARAVADRILRIRVNSMRLAIGSGTASIVFAALATMLLLRVLRGRALLVRENARMLEARSRELEAFAGRVAHDLRDPVNALTLQARVLATEAGLEPARRDASQGVLRQLERMKRVIEGLLEFARQGAGTTGGGGAEVAEVLEDVIEDIRPRAEAAHVSLAIEPFKPVRIACSSGALHSVLVNLVGNAVKYVVDGGRESPVVTVRVAEWGELVRVEVEDNGPGVPPGSHEQVFEPFRRLAGTTQPGVGLGLATVKKIVETCGGHVGVVSQLGKGSVFWFELPKLVASEVERSESTRTPPRARL
jgi:signal transduction histidine kinase